MKLNVETLECRTNPSLSLEGGMVLLDSGVEFKPFEDFDGGDNIYDVKDESGHTTETYIAAKQPGGPRLAIVDENGNRVVPDTFVDDPKSRVGVAIIVPQQLVDLANNAGMLQVQAANATQLAEDYYTLGKYGVRQIAGPELTLDQANSLVSQLSHESPAYTKAFLKGGGVTDITTAPLTQDPYFSFLSGVVVTDYLKAGGPYETMDQIGGVTNGLYSVVNINGTSGSISTLEHERSHVVDQELGNAYATAEWQGVHVSSSTGQPFLDMLANEDWSESNTKYLEGDKLDPVREAYFDNLYTVQGWK